eukprot:7838078-Lingulodinium_polyedra.AAC.1
MAILVQRGAGVVFVCFLVGGELRCSRACPRRCWLLGPLRCAWAQGAVAGVAARKGRCFGIVV